ncbi:MAG: chloride channel protein [Oscillospiraceae bacterium]|nr:chloride channel protein [Oscillospiraceae bacterium]
MEAAKHFIKRCGVYILTFLKWIAVACVVGTVIGFVGTVFAVLIGFFTGLRADNPWILFTLPVIGVAIALLYRAMGVKEDEGTNLVLMSIRTHKKVPLNMAFLIFTTTVLTHLGGGSAGREGAALQLGGSLAAFLGKIFKFEEKDVHVTTMCGMSAAFAAVFGMPLTAAVFSIEVISIGIMHYSAIVPCVFASIIGFNISRGLGLAPENFAISGVPELGIKKLALVVVLALLCALLSIIMCQVVKKTGWLSRKLIKVPELRAAVGGVLIIALTFIVGSRDYNGGGMHIVMAALEGNAFAGAFVLKIIFTAITLGFGFKGGEIVPAFFIGSTFGCVVGPLLGLDPSFAAGIGLVAMFCGVTNCPLTSILLSIELFGSQGVLYFAAAVAVSYMMSGHFGLYSNQKLIYSKLKAEYIDREVGT